MQTVIIGAGIIGLHIAFLLKQQGHDVYVLEKEPYLAEHTSGRNSGVIHAGIFYQPDSFKETICIEGNRYTYEWCQKLDVPHRRCGKWVVPEIGQETEMDAFYEKILALPIPTPEKYTASVVREKEPLLRSTEALFVPSTGILDAATYVKNLATYAETTGVSLLLNCQVTKILNHRLETSRGPIEFDLAINAAGLWSDELAAQTGLEDYSIKPCRGDYYQISSCPISKPVYHLPYKNAHGLGVHLTPTIDHQLLLGPNAFFIESDKDDYRHQSDDTPYYESLKFYLPEWGQNKILQPAYSGNRPKLYHKGFPKTEFVIENHNNWIHLLGIESPGLTSAPALAKHVLSKLI